MRKTAVVSVFSITGLLFACVGWAAPAGQVQNASGFVVLESRDVAPRVASAGASIEPGMTIRTGDRSNVVLRFRDGQLVALTENSTFRLDGYTYDQAEPEKGRFAGSFLRGSARFVTGAIGDSNPKGWRVAMPTATVGIHGTDLVLGMQQVGYVQVINGEVVLMNNAGSVVFNAGQIGHAPSANALATLIAELPASVAANFSNATALSLSATGGSAAGAGLAGGAAGIPIPVWGLIGIGAAGAAAAGGGSSSGGGTIPTTTHH